MDYLDKYLDHGLTFQCKGAEKGDVVMVQVLKAALLSYPAVKVVFCKIVVRTW